MQDVGGIVEHGRILVRLALFSMFQGPHGGRGGRSAGHWGLRRAARRVTSARHARPCDRIAAIAVDRLVKVYKTVTAVDGISFAIAGRLAAPALLGGNGAGKTTTIAMIMGLVTPTSGQRHGARRRDAAAAPPGAAPDEFREPLCRHADAADGAAEPERCSAALRRARMSPAASEQLADELDLHDFLDRQTGKLSSGQKTRVALAKSLINQPEVLLLDEPTASLDPDTADWVRGRLERYRRERGATILLASHNMNEVERLCERVIMHEARPHRGRRHAGAAARALRPQQSGRGVPRHRARPRRGAGGGAMSMQSPAHVAFSPRRVAAMVLRYWYLLRSSWPRMLDLIYWPAVQMLMWGFLQLYVSQNSGFFAKAAGIFIGAVLLWDILFRGQLGFSISFLEEMYSRNSAT